MNYISKEAGRGECEGGKETAMEGMDLKAVKFLFWADAMWHCALEKYVSERTYRRFLACVLHSPRALGCIKKSCPLAHPY